jgi:hypothetical protein
MRKPEWPGIATAVGIVLIITMVFWLGLNGPIDINKIKDWQTLITGVLALVAAGGAYWGATAKVRFDREVADGELKRRKLALYLKLEFAFAQLYDRAKIVDERFTFPPINESWYFKVADIEIKEPLELEEAWTYLDIFPSTTIAEIRSVRNSLRGLQAICDGLGDQLLEIKPDVENPIGNEISGCASEIWMACEIVNAELNPLIERLAPAIPLNDRMIRIYGEP